MYIDRLGDEAAPVSPTSLTVDTGTGEMTLSYLASYVYSPPPAMTTASAGLHCCGGQPYDPDTECCCLYGHVISASFDTTAARVAKAPIDTGVKTYKKSLNVQGGIHKWVEWDGTTAEFNNPENANTFLYYLGSLAASYGSAMDTEVPTKQSPCAININLFKQQMATKAAAKHMQQQQATLSYNCQHYAAELVNDALNASAGCTMPALPPTPWPVVQPTFNWPVPGWVMSE